VPYPFPISETRMAALEAAVTMHAAIHGDLALQIGVDRAVTIAEAETEIRNTADVFAAWLLGTTTIHFTPGPVYDQTTGQPTDTHDEENTMQLTDSQKSSLTVATRDARGFDTPDQVEWALTPDDGSIVTATVSDDSKTLAFSAVAPGQVDGTVTDNSVDPPLSAPFVISVVPAGTTTITISEGAVEEQ
jgi:hypothetical protein